MGGKRAGIKKEKIVKSGRKNQYNPKTSLCFFTPRHREKESAKFVS